MRGSIRRRRIQITLVAMVCLLFQQFAVAAYACSATPGMRGAPIAMAQNCESMRAAPAHENLPLCAKHCAPDVSVTADKHAPTVPALVLPAPVHTAAAVVQSARQLVTIATIAFHRSDPPPRLRYCSLQI